MTDKKKLIEHELLEILEEAIKEEIASTNRYKRGAQLAEEQDVIRMFEQLAADEAIHEKILKERYYDIKKRLGLKLINDDIAD